MTKVTMTYDLHCSADNFWKLFLDSATSVTLFTQRLGFSAYEILECRDDPAEVVRKVWGEPRIDAPAVVQKLLGPRFGYTEEGHWDKATRVWHYKLTPQVFAQKSDIRGTMRVDGGEGRCRMRNDLTIDVRIPGIGGLVEGTARKNITTGWEQSVSFYNECARRGLVESGID